MAKSTISTRPFSIANCWFTRGYIPTFSQSLSQSMTHIIPDFPINIPTFSQSLSHWIDCKIPLNHYKSHSNPISTGQSGKQKARAPLTRRHRHIERHRAGLQTCVLKGVTWVFLERWRQQNHWKKPIGSMVLVYMLTFGVYWWDPCHI